MLIFTVVEFINVILRLGTIDSNFFKKKKRSKLGGREENQGHRFVFENLVYNPKKL